VISWQVKLLAEIGLILAGYWIAGRLVVRAIQRLRASDINGGDES